jgi:hypothetical protein
VANLNWLIGGRTDPMVDMRRGCSANAGVDSTASIGFLVIRAIGSSGMASRRQLLARLWSVVEYREPQHDRRVAHFDKPERVTVSGVHRGIQRAL